MKMKIDKLKTKTWAVGRKAKRLLGTALTALLLFQNSTTAYASGIQGSQIVKGTEKLIGDATTWLMVLAPVVAGLLIIYFCIRRSAADEMDQSVATRCY